MGIRSSPSSKQREKDTVKKGVMDLKATQAALEKVSNVH